MYWANGFTLTTGLCGLVFVSTAVVLYRFPPKHINYLYGYRTAKSMKSQQHWDFAQKFSALRMIEAGIFLIILAGISAFAGIFNTYGKEAVFAGLGFILLAVIYLFVRTQKAIDKKFKDNNHE
ncbi:SdpI family protein [Leeuwenhoekiella sp. H156]|uniref:SdpI family protein n=1 Tax=Leeuwenhoekiella sp. H156 TaxID=3450128 RepID=UPI003FA42788